MPRPLGLRQLQWLTLMALDRFQVVGDPLTKGLVRRGFAISYSGENGFVGPTAAGLRALADAIDAGRIAMPDPRMKPRKEPRE